MPPTTSVTVRMYNVGFGDSFLVTVARGTRVWRMLVDCGVHMQGHVKVNGKSRGISTIVATIIADLEAAAKPGEPPHLDVIVATHRHADHISGFSLDAWKKVAVDEVWVPFVEDPDDADGKALRMKLTAAAQTLQALIDARGGANGGAKLAMADGFALNALSNADAMDRLLGKNGKGFATPATVRYLPNTDAAANTIATGIPRATVHVLGPSRDPQTLKRMDPSEEVAWLAFATEQLALGNDTEHLFDAPYRVAKADIGSEIPDALRRSRDTMKLHKLSADEDELLAASSVLERSVNNTSVFFVLDVDGKRLLFVGDSQQGAWDHVLDNDEARTLISNVDFYKIGHHGSHNATPRRFVEEVLGDGARAMLPWGLVKAWEKTIPKSALIDGLLARHTEIVRADDPRGVDVVVGPDNLWCELTL